MTRDDEGHAAMGDRSRRAAHRPKRSAVCGLFLATAVACSPLARDFGYTPDDRVLRELTVGVDDELTVEELVGRPSSTGVVRASTWYYASSRRETRYFLPPKTTEREIVALSFDDSGVLRNIERFGLQDGRVITLSRRVTDDNTQGITFLQQLFGNLGNFGADSFLDDGGGLP